MIRIPRGILEIGARVADKLLCALAGALLLYLLMPQPEPDVEYSIVRVSAREFAQLEPDTKLSLPEKVVRPPRKLEQRVVADSAGTEQRDRFIAAAAAAQERGNIVPGQPADTATLTRSEPVERLALVYASTWTRARLQLFTITSDGAKERLTYKVCPNGSMVMTGDSALVQGPRICWLPDAAGAIGVGALTYGIIERDPYAIGVGILSLAARKYLLKE